MPVVLTGSKPGTRQAAYTRSPTAATGGLESAFAVLNLRSAAAEPLQRSHQIALIARRNHHPTSRRGLGATTAQRHADPGPGTADRR